MKRIFIFMAVLIVVAGCTSKEETVRSAADGFLSNYWKADYQEARQFCTPDFAALIDTAVAESGSLPDLIREQMRTFSENTSYSIVTIDDESLENRAVIEYELHAAGIEKPLRKRLVMVREGKKYLVDDMD
ncbi:MAG: hypothetical protein MJY70_03265 [Bacteroidales bacterium]|nr:hypothetical protein [Bacteroidales bacterium]